MYWNYRHRNMTQKFHYIVVFLAENASSLVKINRNRFQQDILGKTTIYEAVKI